MLASAFHERNGLRSGFPVVALNTMLPIPLADVVGVRLIPAPKLSMPERAMAR